MYEFFNLQNSYNGIDNVHLENISSFSIYFENIKESRQKVRKEQLSSEATILTTYLYCKGGAFNMVICKLEVDNIVTRLGRLV